MSPFEGLETASGRSLWGRIVGRPAVVVFLLCLVLGMVFVGWRVRGRAQTAHVQARSEALARAAAMELQFSRAVSAAEVLGVLARQGGGAIPSFTKVAAELLAARPGVLSLELQPGGIVSDIVPRLGNERAIGFNVLKDPAQRAGANTAIQSRVLTVAGPLTLYHGEPGLVARVPVFQQGRDGRDYFWGFVAVSMRFSDALARAGLDEVSTRGYNYALFAPGVAGQKAVTFAGRGGLPPQDAVQQPIRAQNIEFRLALWPRGGWVSTTKALVESLGVLLLSGLLGLLAYLVGTQRQMEASLSDLDHRLTRETADRKKAQEDLGRAKDAAAAVQADLKQTQAAVQRAESAIAEAQARVETATHAEKETAAAAAVQLRQDQTTIAELRSSLESALRSARQDAEACAANRHKLEETNRQLRESLVAAEQARASAIKPPSPAPPSPAPSEAPVSKVSPAPEASSVPAAKPKTEPPVAKVPADPAESRTTEKPVKVPKRKKSRRDSQMDLFGGQPPVGPTPPAPVADLKPEPKPEEDKSAPVRRLPAPAPVPVNPAQLRKAVNEILPLLTDQDPGANDCLKANHVVFRSAFVPESYAEFGQLIENGQFGGALELLKKVARKQGIPV